jgi:ribosomal protein L34E
MNHLDRSFSRCLCGRFSRTLDGVRRKRPEEMLRDDPQQRHGSGNGSCLSEKRCRREEIGMRTFVATLLTVLVGLFVGFVLFELAAIVLSGHAAEAGVGRILIRFALACGGIALIVAILRCGTRWPSPHRN